MHSRLSSALRPFDEKLRTGRKPYYASTLVPLLIWLLVSVWPFDFLKIQAPLIAPGVISGALFAFITSFDEVVIVLFVGGPEQYTLPRQMWSGIRNEISPTILAAATILVIFSILLLTTLEMLRRRAEKIRGITPQ